MRFCLAAALGVLGLSALAEAEPPPALFSGFAIDYPGRATLEVPAGSYRNPILPGFRPDPTICRVGADYYVACSSFVYWPGIPLYHSRDLVHWEHMGDVITRPGQADFSHAGVSRGVFAPTLRFHGSRFYLANTLVDHGGNCIFTAADPAGPWSDPVFLRTADARGVDGIDPSLFFDDDGACYLAYNAPPPGTPRYDGHRAIWIRRIDPETGACIGEEMLAVDGGSDPAAHPVWIEGPHLFRRGGFYLLICAEGGTAEAHSEVAFRSRSLRGPWQPYARNPILTQRDLPEGRPNAVSCAGHADFVDTPSGDTWAVFLGCRPYDSADRLCNTGRETFLLPVTWTGDGWPRILPKDAPIPLVRREPAVAGTHIAGGPPSEWRTRFDESRLDSEWVSLRAPSSGWARLGERSACLAIHPSSDRLDGTGTPAFLARRQEEAAFTAVAELNELPRSGVSAGLAVFQSETHHFYLGAADGVLFLERAQAGLAVRIAQMPIPGKCALRLKAECAGPLVSFSVSLADGPWTLLGGEQDATILSTASAGGFVGTTIGLHARVEQVQSR